MIHDNWSLFEYQIPYMAEFHFKNTNALFDATFGFSPEEVPRGIVDLSRLKQIIDRHLDGFPRDQMIGYLELVDPKLGRDYSDHRLRDMIVESVAHIRHFF
ncbi:MAG TPA: hypothetical protein VMY18_05540, partial [Acidobacteriota bacterium]|nr:hypothetical protein [Acidobacteriota bacterium]